jgi:5-methylcytosine-specific restriction protein A
MAESAKTPCRSPGCSALISEPGYCDQHRKQKQREQDARRGSSAERGYGYRWQQYREVFLRENPLCVHCAAEGRTTASNEVDHIKPHRGDAVLFWDPSNHQALCKSCHSAKTAGEDGAFGNADPRAGQIPGGGKT